MSRRGSSSDPQWYKDAVIYQLHVRSFFDQNGDGIGDFTGLIEKLDYLKELGVSCLWLLPFYRSPLRDDGYDIAHYEDIHPSYGTMQDFRAFLRRRCSRRPEPGFSSEERYGRGNPRNSSTPSSRRPPPW